LLRRGIQRKVLRFLRKPVQKKETGADRERFSLVVGSRKWKTQEKEPRKKKSFQGVERKKAGRWGMID